MQTTLAHGKTPARSVAPPSIGQILPKPGARIFQEIPVSEVTLVATSRTEASYQSLHDLAENIRHYGVLEPILVRRKPQGGYELVAGERRLQAAAMAGLQFVPAMVFDVSRVGADQIHLVENVQRENLSMLDEARALEAMLKTSGALEAVARSVNKSKAWVCERLQLLHLEPAAKSLMDEGVTSDVNVLNAINRAARIDGRAALQLAVNVRTADKKRELARAGLESIRREFGTAARLATADLPPDASADDPAMRRDLGRLAAEIMRIGSSEATPGQRGREVRSVLAHSQAQCRAQLETLLQRAFALGRRGSDRFSGDLNEASSELLELLRSRPRHLQQLIVRAYSVGLTQIVFDFQQVAIY